MTAQGGDSARDGHFERGPCPGCGQDRHPYDYCEDREQSTAVDPLAEVKRAVAAVTVHLLVNPDDEVAVRAAAADRRDLPPLEIHVSSQPAPPAGQMYVWTGDQMSGNYNIHTALAADR